MEPNHARFNTACRLVVPQAPWALPTARRATNLVQEFTHRVPTLLNSKGQKF